jgi:hypothetical protein
VISMITDFKGRACALCGEDDPRILMEAHHVFGRGNSPEIIIVCHNCHDKITHDQNLFPPKARSKKADQEDKRDFEDVSIGSLLELTGKRLKRRGLGKHGKHSP